MGKFSLKKSDGDDDSSRLALFGSRSKSKSPAPPSDNPYAQAALPPDPYTRAKMNAGIGPPPPGPPGGQGSQGGAGGQGTYGSMGQPAPRQPYGGGSAYGGPSQQVQGGDDQYGPSQRGGYGPEKFGNQNGYGAQKSGGNPYGGFSQTSGTSRTGGYGGLGPTNDYNLPDDSNRDELFGAARERIEQRQQNNPNLPPDYQYNGGDNGAADRSYGAYGDRQLTAEEEEEEDIQATKQEIRFIKQSDVSSTRNALAIAAQAEESGRNTLARLGAQGERMHNTERNLDIGNNHINIAEDKSKELKTLNRSMFAVHMNNPFTAKDRQAQKDEKIMERHRMEREQRESTREQTFKSTQRMNQNFKGIEDSYTAPAPRKANLAERAKYQFEADEEDDQMEDEIDRNLDQLSGAAKRLNLLARATGEEVETQNKLIGRIAEKVRCAATYESDLKLTSFAERPLRRPTSLGNRKAQAYPLETVQQFLAHLPRLPPCAGHMITVLANILESCHLQHHVNRSSIPRPQMSLQLPFRHLISIIRSAVDASSRRRFIDAFRGLLDDLPTQAGPDSGSTDDYEHIATSCQPAC
jgi:protein transport protein SEC9